MHRIKNRNWEAIWNDYEAGMKRMQLYAKWHIKLYDLEWLINTKNKLEWNRVIGETNEF